MTIIREFELKQMVNDGLSTKEIASLLYCSKATVNRAIKKLGIRPVYVVYNRDIYLRMKEIELTDDNVAHIWGVTYHALQCWKSREGLSIKPGRMQQLQKIEEEQK